MNHFLHYMEQLRMPAIISDQSGSITAKNNSSRKSNFLRKKRNLFSMLSSKEQQKYLSLWPNGGAEIFTLCYGVLREQGFAVVSDGLCRWYFPASLQRNLILRTEELSSRGVTSVFCQSETAILNSRTTKISEVFSEAAIRMIANCYPEHHISLKNFICFTRISSHLLFKSDCIRLPNDNSAFVLDYPETAYRAAGEILSLLMGETSAPAELILKDGQIFFIAGDKCFNAGTFHIMQTVCAMAPYNYEKADAAAALAASCSAELLLFNK